MEIISGAALRHVKSFPVVLIYTRSCYVYYVIYTAITMHYYIIIYNIHNIYNILEKKSRSKNIEALSF
ncbi:hypothetical protein PUN28_006390 [Cardiocondyla obscurior]|uniref:Uncharacterized protein n=1 Tax=Cardiocondyla obscurior TaxID=286306 RepID=A0AAW2GBB4_9HYME